MERNVAPFPLFTTDDNDKDNPPNIFLLHWMMWTVEESLSGSNRLTFQY